MTFNHAPSGVAVHWHSRSVLTPIDAVPPEAGKVEADASVVTEHLDSAVGAVMVLAEEPQPICPRAAAKTAAITRRIGDRRGVLLWPIVQNGCGRRLRRMDSAFKLPARFPAMTVRTSAVR